MQANDTRSEPMMTQFTFILNYECVFLIPIFRHLNTSALCDLCVLCGSIFVPSVTCVSSDTRRRPGTPTARACLPDSPACCFASFRPFRSMSSVRIVSCLPPAMSSVTESFVFERMKPTIDLAVVRQDRGRDILRIDLLARLDDRLDDVVPVEPLADVGQLGAERETDFADLVATGTHAAEDVAAVVGVAGEFFDRGVRFCALLWRQSRDSRAP